LTSSDDSSTEGEEEVQGGSKEDASDDAKEEPRRRRMKPPWLTLTMKTVHPEEGASVAEGFAPSVLSSRRSGLMAS